jgi:peptide chain release factor 2
MTESNFWDDSAGSNKLVRELKYLKGCVEPFNVYTKRLSDLKELIDLSSDDPSSLKEIETELTQLKAEVDQLELQSLLAGEFDRNNAILSINAGAGGTESCDWVSMLFRMYVRFAEGRGYKVKTIDMMSGEEAGVKSVTISIEGDMAYGYLKAEKGVHRLVRISPFDSNKRRHTSFASVDVIPEIEDDIQIDIPPDELKIDLFRSSGPGGQSVNTTDSAVRITHIPTGLVQASQNERSQLQNRQTAMKLLKAKIYAVRQQEQEERMSKEYGEKRKIEWGSQIRSYVMHPYSMVKDHRTDAETGNVNKVMDGDLNMFIEAFLKGKRKEKTN